jgi:DNA-binding PadR family transcriptional regulator
MTNAELVLLSLIAERPRHGYDLERVIEEQGMRNWTEIAFSSIYYVLNQLVKQGVAVAHAEPAAGRGPARKVFAITPAGVTALKAGVYQGLATPEPGSREFMLGLSCLPLLTREEALQALTARQTALQLRLSELEAHPALSAPGFPAHVRAMFTYSLPLLHAELEWLETFIQEVAQGDIYGKDRPA